MASKRGRPKKKLDASVASSSISPAEEAESIKLEQPAQSGMTSKIAKKKKEYDTSVSKASSLALSVDDSDAAPRRARRKKKVETSISQTSTSVVADDDIDAKMEETVKSIKDKLRSDVDGMLEKHVQSTQKIARQITEFSPIFLCQDFTPNMMAEDTNKPAFAGETPSVAPSTSSVVSKTKKVNFSAASNYPSSSHSHLPDSSSIKTPRAGPSHNKVAFVTPGPSFTQQSKVKILRIPQSGETCISMAGSPLLIAPDPAHAVPRLTIPTADGRVVEVIAGDCDDSFNDVVMSRLEMKPSVQKHLKKMTTILNKLLEEDECF